MNYGSLTSKFPNAIANASKGLGLTEADWRALGPNCQAAFVRVPTVGWRTAQSNASGYANQPYQGLARLVLNPYYVPRATSGILLPRQAQPALNEFGGQLIITQGGQYTVNASSSATGTHAVDIRTSEFVDIIGGTTLSAGDAFRVSGYGNVRIRNVKSWGLPPTVDGATHGKFINAFRPRKAIVENNIAQSLGTMILFQERDDTALADALEVRRNILYDINGRLKNGSYPNEKSNGIQYDGQTSRPGMVIEDNYIENEQAATTAEDNFNIHNSSGTAASPVIVRRNLVNQSYGPTGSGFTSDGDKSKQADPATAAAFIEVYGNYFLGVRNGSINNSGGHDINCHDNYAISANLNSDGSPRNPSTYSYNSGLSIANSTNAPASAFFNNRMYDNVLAITHPYYHVPMTGRHDLASPTYSSEPWRNNIIPITDNTMLLGDLPDGTVSRAMEQQFLNFWLQTQAQLGNLLGPLTNR